MRKKLLDAPPEAGAIETYTAELSRRLRGSVPGERADEIVREAEAHLHDQADTFAKASQTSLPRREAEACAVAAFAPPVAFARDMAQSAVETRFSKAWFGVSKTVAVVALGVLAAGFVVDGLVDGLVILPYTIGSALVFSQPIFAGLFLLLWLCAFLARRAQTVRLLFVTTLLGAFMFAYSGFFYVIQPQSGMGSETPRSRLNARDNYKGWHDLRLHVKHDEKQLLAGLRVYRAKNPIVPAELQTANGKAYRIPSPILKGVHLAHTGQPDSTYYFPLEPSYTMSAKTVSEARAHWLTDGPAYLAQARYEQNDVLRYEEPLRVASQQTGFSVEAGRWNAVDILIPGLFLMLFDWLFARLGRAVYAKRRARREQKMAQA